MAAGVQSPGDRFTHNRPNMNFKKQLCINIYTYVISKELRDSTVDRYKTDCPSQWLPTTRPSPGNAVPSQLLRLLITISSIDINHRKLPLIIKPRHTITRFPSYTSVLRCEPLAQSNEAKNVIHENLFQIHRPHVIT